jgi:hypothetical protein
MTDHAVGGARQIFAALNHVGALKVGGNAGRIGGVVVGKWPRCSAGERQRPGIEHPPQDDASDGQNDRGDEDNNCFAHCA